MTQGDPCVGRVAPAPTGPRPFGSLVAAVAGFLYILMTGLFGLQPDYRLAVDVIRLEAVPGREALLQARWAVADGSGNQVLAAGSETLTEPLATTDFGALVAAESRLLETLSRRIAKAIADLPR